MNIRRLPRILLASLLFLLAALYISHIIPEANVDILFLLSWQKWLSVLSLFLIVQLLTVAYFYLIIARMCNITSPAKLFQVLFASYSFNYAGPLKLGIPMRVFLFKRVLGIPYAAGLATVMATTGLDVLVMIIIVFALAAWIYISPFAGLILGPAAVLALLSLRALFDKLPYTRPKRPKWLANFLSDVSNLSPFTIFLAVVISTIRFFLISLSCWLVLAGLGRATSFAELTFVYFSSHLAGLLSFIPMGIGIKDASLIELLGRMGISPAVGIGFVAIDRFIWCLIPLLIGIVAGWHLGVNALIKSAKKEVEKDKHTSTETGRSLIRPY